MTRILHPEPMPEPLHHALDEVLLERVSGSGEPVVRFWYRDGPAVPLGRFQSYHDEVETDYAETKGIDVVRRITGGGSMYVAPGEVITYSLYLPENVVASDVEASYAELDAPALQALTGLGVDVFHEPLNDIAHADGKVGGSAQLRVDGAVLHHTTMSYDLDVREMLRVLRIGKEKVSDKAVKSAEKRVTRIADYVDTDIDDVIDALEASFVDAHGGESDELTDDELDAARRLATEKFSTAEWNRQL